MNPIPPSSIEGNLDIQLISAIGKDAVSWYWSEKNWVYDWASSFISSSLSNLPSVVSLSVGWAEYDQCAITPECSTLGVDTEGYVRVTNEEFMKIALSGVSILVSSGDSGAHGRTDLFCADPTLHPNFPAASPYVTAVGGTEIQKAIYHLKDPPPACDEKRTGYKCLSGGEEVAASYEASGYTSGGGFSVYADRPSYQERAVKEYLSLDRSSSLSSSLSSPLSSSSSSPLSHTTHNITFPPSSMWNHTSRGYPDISLLGNNALMVDTKNLGGLAPEAGTSVSAPVLSGFISLLNSLSRRTSGKPLGFLNPLLYKMYYEAPQTFRDITVGDNRCTEYGCNGDGSCKGFYAAPGWDAVTGLGVPNVGEMAAYIEAMGK